jgi:hypothetical protein
MTDDEFRAAIESLTGKQLWALTDADYRNLILNEEGVDSDVRERLMYRMGVRLTRKKALLAGELSVDGDRPEDITIRVNFEELPADGHRRHMLVNGKTPDPVLTYRRFTTHSRTAGWGTSTRKTGCRCRRPAPIRGPTPPSRPTSIS